MKQILFISGKGGTGKTVITASFAVLNNKSIIADCDVDAACLHLLLNPQIIEKNIFIGGKKSEILQNKCKLCGKCFKVCVFNAVLKTKVDNYSKKNKYLINSLLCEGCGVCVWNCPESAIEFNAKEAGEWYVSKTEYGTFIHARLIPGEENSGKLVNVVKKIAKEKAIEEKSDLIIIDGPPGTGCPVICSLSGVDLAVIVTEPSVSGIYDMERVLELAQKFNVKCCVIINKYNLNLKKTQEIREYCEKRKIKILGIIPFSEEINQSVVMAKPAVLYCNNEIKKTLHSICEKIGEELK